MKKTAYALLIIVALAAIVHFSFWMYSAKWFEREIGNVQARVVEKGIVFTGPAPTLENFPFIPEVHYTQGFEFGNATLTFPNLILRGYPLPFTTLTLDFPQGAALGGIVDPSLWAFDRLTLKVKVPHHFPRSMAREDLSAWQQAGGKIDVRDYQFQKSGLMSEGRGYLSLDENLQPVFFMDAILYGHENFIAAQRDAGLIEPFPAAFAATLLNSLAKQDETTGERYVPINISVRNRMLTVGPVQAIQLPEIFWDTHTTPDPRQ